MYGIYGMVMPVRFYDRGEPGVFNVGMAVGGESIFKTGMGCVPGAIKPENTRIAQRVFS